MIYTEVRVKGILSQSWSDWFDEMQMDYDEHGVTVLCGQLPDQAAVYGMLSRLGSLGLPLVSVTCHLVSDV